MVAELVSDWEDWAPATNPELLRQTSDRVAREAWLTDDEGKWNYLTAPGSQTMEVLRERFGEASFCDGPTWPRWDLSGEGAAVWQTQRTAVLPAPALPARFQLTSPKLHKGAVSSFAQDALQVKALEQSSSLGGTGQMARSSNGRDCRTGRQWVPVGQA